MSESPKEMDEKFGAAAKEGDLALMASLLPRVSDNACKWALKNAAFNGHLKCTQWLRTIVQDSETLAEALSDAAEKGHENVVRDLLQVVSPNDFDSLALRGAVMGGRSEMVSLFLRYPHSPKGLSLTFVYASLSPHTVIWRELLDRCSPSEIDRAFVILWENRFPAEADSLSPHMSNEALARIQKSDLTSLPSARARRCAPRLETALPAPARAPPLADVSDPCSSNQPVFSKKVRFGCTGFARCFRRTALEEPGTGSNHSTEWLGRAERWEAGWTDRILVLY